jgi:enoyl-CoA hydratase/carnithine racemase
VITEQPQDLIVETHEAVCLLRINRPKARNALSIALRQRISDAIMAADRDDKLRAVVLTGSADCFSAGGDIKEFPEAADSRDAMFESQRVWMPLATCRIPIIAAVEGIALGGGAELAMLCDIIVAGDTAEFAFPEVRLGILPGNGGTQRLPRAAGKFRAMRYLLTGDRIPAARAETMGLVSEVVPAGQALETALGIARQIAALPPLAVRQIKDVVRTGADVGLPAALTIEREGSRILMRTSDHKEAAAAFIEKRKPRFTGN